MDQNSNCFRISYHTRAINHHCKQQRTQQGHSSAVPECLLFEPVQWNSAQRQRNLHLHHKLQPTVYLPKEQYLQKYLCENSSENSDTKVYSRSFAKIKSISKFIQTLVLRYEVSIRVLHCLEPTAWEDEAVYDKIGHL